MKKVALLIAIILTLLLVLTSCGSNYTWDDALSDIDKLKEADFEFLIEDEPEMMENLTEIFNSGLEVLGLHSSVTLTHLYQLYSDDGQSVVAFVEFETEQQAKQTYLYCRLSVGEKAARMKKIIIFTNSESAVEILKYDFKSGLGFDI